MTHPFTRPTDSRVSVDLLMDEGLLDRWDSGTDPKFLAPAYVGLYRVGRLPSPIKSPLARVSVADRTLEVECGVVDLPVPENGMHVGIVYEVRDGGDTVFSCGNGELGDAMPLAGWLNAVTFAEQYAVSEVLGDPYGPTPDGREAHT